MDIFTKHFITLSITAVFGINLLNTVVAEEVPVPELKQKPLTEESSLPAALDVYSNGFSMPISELSNDLDILSIEQQALEPLFNNSKSDDELGQWSVSFDLNRLNYMDTQFSTDIQSAAPQIFDWDLGTSLVSSNQTSRFYVNYGNKKVPISISFDEPTTSLQGLNQQQYKAGFEQQLNESWAVSISYLNAEQKLEQLGGEPLASARNQVNYSFDFNRNNQIETLNLIPFQSAGLGAENSLLDDVSSIEIKVSRQVTDSFALTSKLTDLSSNIESPLSLINKDVTDQLDMQKIQLQGQYRFNDAWSLDANVEKETGVVKLGSTNQLSNELDFDATTLDIGLQYQSQLDQLGVIIRIDLMNLLGVNASESAGHLGLDHNGLIPFSFETPKYIKLSGSINF